MTTTTFDPSTATRIDDLTDEQVLQLADADIDRLIKRAMAEQGIPVLPVPVEPDYLPVPGPDVSLYEVAGELFSSREAAEEVQQVIHRNAATRVKLAYGSNYRIQHVESNDLDVSVTTKMAYSSEAYAEHKAALDENATRKTVYGQDQQAYRAAEQKAAHIREDISGRLRDVREKVDRLDMFATRYVEYLSIANGDATMAMQFLVKAFDLSDEDIAGIRAHERVIASQP